MTKKDLAERTGVSGAAIGQFEAGIVRPRREVIGRMAEVLEVPATFFNVGRPRAHVDASNTHFKSLRSMTGYERDRSVTFTEQVWELAHHLERYAQLPALDLPSIGDDVESNAPQGSNGLRHANAHAAARRVRRAWRLGDHPIAHLVRLLEIHGILVALLPFSDSGRVSAFSTSRTDRPVIILTSDRDDVYRHRFAAAHELGHLLLHPRALPGDVAHEREADAFAAEFLMPAHRLQSDLPKRIDLARLVQLSGVWGVSVEALLYRGRELGVYSDATHRRGRIKLNGNREAIRSASIGDFSGEQPKLLQQAMAVATSVGGGSWPGIANELCWKPEALRDLIGESSFSRPVVVLTETSDASSAAKAGGD